MNSNQHAGNPPTGEMPSNGTENINMGTGTAYPIAAPVPDAPVPSAPPVPSPAPKAPEQSHSHLHIIQFKRGGRSRVASRI